MGVVMLLLGVILLPAHGLRASMHLRGGGPGVEVYTTPGCRFCAIAKGFLRGKGVPYDELDVSECEERLGEMIERAKSATLPQIFIAGEHVGGCTQMLEEHERGLLEPRLERIGIKMLDTPSLTTSVEISYPSTRKVRRKSNSVLNEHTGSFASGTAADISAALQKRMLLLMDEHLSPDGTRVNYASLQVSPSFADFCDAAGELAVLPAGALDSSIPLNERKAFWINLYNCLVLHATAVLGAPEDSDERSAFFSGTSGAAYRIAGHRLCLDEIEHGILRANAPQVGKSVPIIDGDDPRIVFVLPKLDRALPLTKPKPFFLHASCFGHAGKLNGRLACRALAARIHFALNCGARSCPPIKFYNADRVEESLQLAAQAFLEADLEVHGSTVVCTRLLDWYGGDFGSTVADVISCLQGMLATDSALYQKLTTVMEFQDEVTMEFRAYDWSSNSE